MEIKDVVFNSHTRHLFTGTPEEIKLWIQKYEKYHEGLMVHIHETDRNVTAEYYLVDISRRISKVKKV